MSGLTQIFHFFAVVRPNNSFQGDEPKRRLTEEEKQKQVEEILHVYDKKGTRVVKNVCESVTIFEGKQDVIKLTEKQKLNKWNY